MPNIDLSILNQRQTPAFYADVFANRPAAGFVGRIFVSTNTFAFYRDNGTGWDLIGGPGTGTITGSGTAGTVPLWNGASTIGDSSLIEGSTKFTTTKDIQADGYYLSGMTAGSGALYWTSDRVTLANYNPTGTVEIEVAGGARAQLIAADLSTTFYGNIIRNGGTSSQFLKADGSLDNNTYNTGSGAASQVAFFSGTNAITGENNLWWDSVNNHFGINTNVPGTAADIHHDQSTILQLNQTVATNDTRIAFQNSGATLWRIGNFYNAGANDWGIFDVVGSIQPLTVKKTTGQVLIGTSTVGSGKLVVASSNSDNGVQIVGAAAPSLRIDNAESGPTKRVGLGISTATNNFIQGSADRDMCIFNGSTTASPMLFGIYDTTNVQEAARISAARNFLIGTTTDNGSKLQVNGTGRITGALNVAQLGINTTINSWGTGYESAIQIGPAGSMFAYSNAVQFGSNYYFNGSNYIAIQTGSAGKLSFNGNQFNIEIAASVSAGNALTFTNPLSIASTGAATFSNNVFSNNAFIVSKNGSDTIGAGAFVSLQTATGTNYQQNIQLSANGNLDFWAFDSASWNNRMRLVNGTGNLLIGTTTDNGNKLRVNGSQYIDGFLTIQNVGANIPALYVNQQGNNDDVIQINSTNINTYAIKFLWYGTNMAGIQVNAAGSAVAYNTTFSDINKKKNFENWNDNVLDLFKTINPQKFNFINEDDIAEKTKGFIAQELVDKFPEAYPINDEGFYTFNPSGMVTYLMKAIQELNTKIENLK